MENKAKIRINLNSREFEIEGSEEFVNSHATKIESFLELLKVTPITPLPPKQDLVTSTSVVNTVAQLPTTNGTEAIPETFGEFYHNMPKTSKEIDKILVAGYYAQKTSSDNSFSTNDASKLLLEQGIKLSNPAMFITRNEKAKNLIKLSKGKFRISKTGNEYIQQLLSSNSENK